MFILLLQLLFMDYLPMNTNNSNTTSAENPASKKSVRFSRFEKVFYTHAPCDYDRTSLYPSLLMLRRASLPPIPTQPPTTPYMPISLLS